MKFVYFLFFFIMSKAYCGPTYSPYIISRLMQFDSVHRYLDESQHGSELIRNAFTVQLLNDLNHFNRDFYEVSFLDVLIKLEKSEILQRFFLKNEVYQEYVIWLEQQLAKTLFSTLDEFGIASFEKPIIEAFKEKNRKFFQYFSTKADLFLSYQITSSYEQMYSVTTYGFMPTRNSVSEQSLIQLLDTSKMPNLFSYIAYNMPQNDEFKEFYNQKNQTHKLAEKYVYGSNYKKFLGFTDREFVKTVFMSLVGQDKKIDLKPCNLFLGMTQILINQN